MSKVHLVIPDSHAHPSHHNRRYDLLGKLILDLKPDVVVDIGDWWDMESLCTHDRGKSGFTNRRYQRDIAVGVEAQDRIYRMLRRRKKKLPRMVRCLGNHENRIKRAIEMQPELLEGIISLDDLQSREYGWEQHEFNEAVRIDGVNYAHYFTSGVMGRPVASARALMNHQGVTCVMGHAHTYDHFTKTNIEGKRRHAIICGVYQDYVPPFARTTAHLWRAGVLVLRDVQNGDFDEQWISLQNLKKAYG